MPLATPNKKKNGFGIMWIPTGSRHKHKKNKYYVRDNNYDPKRAMMSGDSPNSHTKDYFDFKEGRSTPPPTTSKDIAVQSSSGGGETKTEILAASVILDPTKETCNRYVHLTDNQTNEKNHDEIIAQEDKPLKSEHLTDGIGNDKINGMVDRLDGNCSTNNRKDDEDNDENCAVKCLYYTLQCCECTIM